MKIKLKFLKNIGTILTVIGFVFIIRTLLKYDIDYSIIKNHFLLIFGLCLLFMIPVTISSVLWKFALELFSGKEKLSFIPIFNVYTKSNVFKYIPGNVMQYVGRNLLAVKFDLTHTQIVLSTIFEIAFLVITSFLWIIVFARNIFLTQLGQFISVKSIIFFSILLVLALICAIIVASKFKEKIIGYLKLIPKKGFAKLSFKAIVAYSFNNILNGIILILILRLFYNEFAVSESFIVIIISYMIAWLIGYLVPGSPGGVGVREAILLFLLKDIFPQDVIAISVLTQRLISVFGDLFVYFLALILQKFASVSFKLKTQ